MADFDISRYNLGIVAHNSSQQMVETMALHQTIKSQVEETAELHKTIREQIKVTNQQGRLIWWLSIAVAILTLVQAAGTVIQVWPVFQKPEQATHSDPILQQSKEQSNPPPNVVRHEPLREKKSDPPTLRSTGASPKAGEARLPNDMDSPTH